MSSAISEPRPYEQYLLTLALILVSSLLVYTQAAKRLDLLAYDAAINIAPATIDPDTVIIAIDEKSLNGIGQWPWRRAIHAQLINKLSDYNASLVAFDVIFSERDKNYPEDDALLADAIKANGHVLLPLHIHPLSYSNTLTEILPIPELVDAAIGLGHVHVDLDEDGLARGLYLNAGVGSAHWPALSMAMATEINPLAKYIRQIESQRAAPYISVNTQFRLIPFAGPGGSYPTYSYLDVMLDKIPASVFRDKVVLVGATAAGLGDVIPTPIAHGNSPMSGVELHANAYSAIMHDSAIKPIAALWTYLLTFAFIMIPILVFPRLKPTHVMPYTMLLVALVLTFSYALMVYDRSWFPPINSVIGILLAYPLWSWQRMRHLNSFLSMELERLNQQPDLGFRKLGQHSIEKVFLALISLLKPRQYVFVKNNNLLHSFEKENLDQVKLHQSGKWNHGVNCSWIKLKDGRDHYKIGFGWTDDVNRQKICGFLDKLDLSPQNYQKPKRYYEQIANRISQVRDAIGAMQDMRIFISKGFEEMPGAVLVTDPVGMVVYSNSRAMQWLGNDQDALVGASVQEHLQHFTDDMDRVDKAVNAVLLEGQQANFEINLGERDVLVHCLPFIVDANSDAGMMITMSDISAIRQQQREKNQLIDFLSHDVRSPLVSQLAMLQGLRSGRIEWQPELIQEIEQHAKRSLNLSDQFLQITRAEQSAENDFYEFDIITAIENSIDSLAHQANAKSIKVRLEGVDSCWINGNAELIERAFTNLINNAIKYSPQATQVIVSVACSSNKQVKVDITDQGLGISKEEQPFIFRRFRRQRQSEISGEKGAGLGLNFVQVVVNKHGGSISLNSELGQGTTFTVEFPALEPPTE